MGSGGMIVMDESTRMVDVARFFMEFCMDESCGKCVPCRAGTVQMHHLLSKLLSRKATARDLKKLEELCEMVKNTSLCGLGQTAPNPVLSTLRFFRKEYTDLLAPDVFGAQPDGTGNGHPASLGGETASSRSLTSK
jgi:bidirectional [NiFe] hydrogenase diaphorase subunit